MVSASQSNGFYCSETALTHSLDAYEAYAIGNLSFEQCGSEPIISGPYHRIASCTGLDFRTKPDACNPPQAAVG
jgi:hypothetical protein